MLLLAREEAGWQLHMRMPSVSMGIDKFGARQMCSSRCCKGPATAAWGRMTMLLLAICNEAGWQLLMHMPRSA